MRLVQRSPFYRNHIIRGSRGHAKEGKRFLTTDVGRNISEPGPESSGAVSQLAIVIRPKRIVEHLQSFWSAAQAGARSLEMEISVRQ